MSFVVENWNDSLGTITEEKVRALYNPFDHYRLSRHTYASGECSNALHRAGQCYVLEGRLEFESAGGDIAAAERGQIVHFTEGTHKIHVTGSLAVELLYVWDIHACFSLKHARQ